MFNIWRLIFTCVHKCHNRSIAEYFLSEVLRGFFSISKKLYILYEHRGWGILPFEKRTVSQECEKSPQTPDCAVRTTAAAAVLPFVRCVEEAGSGDARVRVLRHSLRLGHAFGWGIPYCAGALSSWTTWERWKANVVIVHIWGKHRGYKREGQRSYV